MMDLGLIGWLVALIAGLVAWIFREREKDAKAERDAARRSAQTHKEMREHEQEASQMDDVSLADRITRGR